MLVKLSHEASERNDTTTIIAKNGDNATTATAEAEDQDTNTTVVVEDATSPNSSINRPIVEETNVEKTVKNQSQ